jgi:UDP-N-acetylmuramate--alanine ligase
MVKNYLAVKYLFGYYVFMSKPKLPGNLNGVKIHLVGIKGTGMAALAEILCARGARLSGSDTPEEFYTSEILAQLGIPVSAPFAAGNIPPGTTLVIHSSAYGRDKNPELIEADRLSIPVMLYTEALGALSAKSFSCGIAGVHGKTTTTGIAGTLLKGLHLNSFALAGSVISSFGNRCTMLNGSKYFVAETCEYQRHFMDFHPKKILLTSIESDHQDCFPTYESILSAFMQYIDLLPQFGELIYCADDPGACEAAKMIFASRPDLVFTGYGEKAGGDYRVTHKGIKDGRLVFSLKGFGGDFKLRVPGKHNALNAAGAIALAVSLLKEEKGSADFKDMGAIREALESFKGSRRRSEIIGEEGGVLVMDDYGHHPTAIAATLSGIREFYPGRRLIVDFMSHTYSRTAALLEEFASCFGAADEILLHKIYASAREQYDGTVTGETLFNAAKGKHKHVRYFPEVMDARSYLAGHLKAGDVFVTMGAGDNWQLGRAVLEDRRKP